jgi:hypothetical protein
MRRDKALPTYTPKEHVPRPSAGNWIALTSEHYSVASAAKDKLEGPVRLSDHGG